MEPIEPKTVRLPASVWRRVEAAARQDERSLSNWLARFLTDRVPPVIPKAK